MPRKKLIYTDQYPYHIRARSNNREWFYIPKEELWEIFILELNQVVKKYELKVHAFVLMDNHYHLLATTSKKFPLGQVMCELQKSVSRKVNERSGRTNHVFGGTYKASLITNEEYYYIVYKYIYRNPLTANLVGCALEYKYSTLRSPAVIQLVYPINGIDSLLDYKKDPFWINESFVGDQYMSVKKGLSKTVFKPISQRDY